MSDQPAVESNAREPGPETPHLSRRTEVGIIVALLMGLLLGALDNFIVATVLPNIATDLNDLSGQVFVVTSYLIAQTVAIPIFGKLSDRFGRRSFYLFGLVIFLLGSVASGLSQNLNQLIAFRAIQGVGSGAFFTVVFSIVADIFPPKMAARLVGILSAVFGIAIVAGPLIGSTIVDVTTWRWIFFVNLPVGIAAIALVLTTMGPMRPSTKVSHPFDALGAILMATWVGTLIYALVQVSAGWAWTDPRTIGLLAVALIVLPISLWQELRAADPLLPLKYFRIRLVSASSGVNFLRGALLVVVVTFVPILVIEGLGGTADISRDVLYAMMIPMVIGAGVSGPLVTRYGYGLPLMIGMALATLGTFFLTQVPTLPPIFRYSDGFIPVGLVGSLVPLGFGVGMTFAPTQLAIQYSVAKEDLGSGTSLVWFISNLGGAIAGSVLGAYQLGVLKTLNLPFFQAHAVSIQDVWWGLIPFAIVGLIFAATVSGRLPKTAEGSGEGAPAAPAMM